MTYHELIDMASNKLNISREVIDKTYRSYWKFIKNSIQELPLKRLDLNEEEFNNLNTSFNIPSLGKIAITWSRYNRVKLRLSYIKHIKDKDNEHKENQTTV